MNTQRSRIIGLLLSAFASSPSLAATNTLTIAVDPKDRSIVVEGGMPLWVATHDSEGHATGGISGNYRDVILNVEKLANAKIGSVQLATQDSGYKNRSAGFIRFREHKAFYIDRTGVVYPDNLREIRPQGPFLRIRFMRDAGKGLVQAIDPKSVKVGIKSSSGKQLSYATDDLAGFVISQVPAERLEITVNAENSKPWTYQFFPYLRGATDNIIEYTAMGIQIGALAEHKKK